MIGILYAECNKPPLASMQQGTQGPPCYVPMSDTKGNYSKEGHLSLQNLDIGMQKAITRSCLKCDPPSPGQWLDILEEIYSLSKN